MNKTLADREALLVSYLPFVRALAERIHRSKPALTLTVDDLVAYGTLGLIDAVDNFDPAKGAKLSTYAYRRVTGSIIDAIRDLSHARRAVTDQAICLIPFHPDSHVSSNPDPLTQLLEAETRSLVLSALAVLPVRDRTMLLSLYFETSTMESVARTVSQSRSWICRRHARALAKLRASVDVDSCC